MKEFDIYKLRVEKQKQFVEWACSVLVEVGMTQQELANAIGCDTTYLCALLNSKTARSRSKWNEKIKAVLQQASEKQSAMV